MKNFLQYMAITTGLLFLFATPACAHNPGAVVLGGSIILLSATVVSVSIKFLAVRYIFKTKNNNNWIKYFLISASEFVLIVISFSMLAGLQIIDQTYLIFAVATLLYLLPASVINNLLLRGDVNNSKIKKWSKPLMLSLIFPVVSAIASTFTLASLYMYFE